MIDPQVAWDKLSGFETAEDLRKYFISENVTGQKSRAQFCPIAKWMMDQTGMRFVVAGHVSTWDLVQDRLSVEFDHTAATREFMINFDVNQYPELVEDYLLDHRPPTWSELTHENVV